LLIQSTQDGMGEYATNGLDGAANACREEVLGADDQPHWKVDVAPRRVFGERTNPSLVV